MEKLRLDLDELKVDSFDAGAEAPVRGTAQAHEGTCSLQPTCGAASRGETPIVAFPPTRYACCV
jgi:hypothetical protein